MESEKSGPDLVIEAKEKVRVIQANLEAAPSRQKRATLAKEESPYNLKLVIMSTYGFHQPKVYNNSE